MMTIEMRKRPVIKGKDALKFLERSELNKQQLIQRSKQAMKNWNKQQKVHEINKQS